MLPRICGAHPCLGTHRWARASPALAGRAKSPFSPKYGGGKMGVGRQRAPHPHHRDHQGAQHPLKLPFYSPFSFYHLLSLAARTPNVSKEHLEEFKAHLHCLGFTDEEVIYTSEKVRTPPQGGRAPSQVSSCHRRGPPAGGGREDRFPLAAPLLPSRSWLLGRFWGKGTPTAALPLSRRTPVGCPGRRREKMMQSRRQGNPPGSGQLLHPHPPPAPPWGHLCSPAQPQDFLWRFCFFSPPG